jgi:hypothetical protein
MLLLSCPTISRLEHRLLLSLHDNITVGAHGNYIFDRQYLQIYIFISTVCTTVFDKVVSSSMTMKLKHPLRPCECFVTVFAST